MTEYKKLDSYISRLDLEYSAVFVPFSKSRSAKEIKTLSDYSINWKVTIKSPSGSIETDYMQGIGHLPARMYHPISRPTQEDYATVKYACENGRKCSYSWGLYSIFGYKESLTMPKLRDVLYCLLLDAEAIEYDFQDWCDNCGYDEDSRKAESMYQECLQLGLKLRKVLGEKHINKLRELYQDY